MAPLRVRLPHPNDPPARWLAACVVAIAVTIGFTGGSPRAIAEDQPNVVTRRSPADDSPATRLQRACTSGICSVTGWAACDGKADDSKAFQAAFDAASSASPPRLLTIPSGVTCILSKGIDGKGIGIAGAGILGNWPESNLGSYGASSRVVWYGSGIAFSDVQRFEGIGLRCVGSGCPASTGIAHYGGANADRVESTGMVVRDCGISGFGVAIDLSATREGGTYDAVVSHNLIVASGIGIKMITDRDAGNPGVAKNLIDNNAIVGFSIAAISCGPNTKSFSVSGSCVSNTISNNDLNAKTDSPPSIVNVTGSQNVIIGNHFENSQSAGDMYAIDTSGSLGYNFIAFNNFYGLNAHGRAYRGTASDIALNPGPAGAGYEAIRIPASAACKADVKLSHGIGVFRDRCINEQSACTAKDLTNPARSCVVAAPSKGGLDLIGTDEDVCRAWCQ